jgi:hypothetical protein
MAALVRHERDVDDEEELKIGVNQRDYKQEVKNDIFSADNSTAAVDSTTGGGDHCKGSKSYEYIFESS